MLLFISGFICGFGVCLGLLVRRHKKLRQAFNAVCDRLDLADFALKESHAREQRVLASAARMKLLINRLWQIASRGGRISDEASTSMIRHQTAIAKGKGRNPETDESATELRPYVYATVPTLEETTSEVKQ